VIIEHVFVLHGGRTDLSRSNSSAAAWPGRHGTADTGGRKEALQLLAEPGDVRVGLDNSTAPPWELAQKGRSVSVLRWARGLAHRGAKCTAPPVSRATRSGMQLELSSTRR
jgi:hypothetical protein